MGIILLIIYIIAMWKIFVKADEPGWAIFIPFYNTYVLFKITKMMWEFLLLIILIATCYLIINFSIQIPVFFLIIITLLIFIIDILLSYRLSKVFGHGIPFALGLIFLPFIFYIVLGFDSSMYDSTLLD